jgi:small subunit ribosomal protein S19
MKASWEKRVIKIWDRASQIIPDMIWFTFAVHNWKQFNSIYISEDMIWHRLWEFAPTRAIIKHTKSGVGATKGTKHKSKK